MSYGRTPKSRDAILRDLAENPILVAAAMALRSCGARYPDISRFTGLCRSQILAILNPEAFEPRSFTYGWGPERELAKETVRMRRAGYSVEEIADKLNKSKPSINWLCRQEISPFDLESIRFSPSARDAKILRLRLEGRSGPEIAALTGLHRSRVIQICRRWLTDEMDPCSIASRARTKRKIRELRLAGCSLERIASRVSLDVSTVIKLSASLLSVEEREQARLMELEMERAHLRASGKLIERVHAEINRHYPTPCQKRRTFGAHNEDQDESILAMRLAGRTYKEIAGVFGLSKATVFNVCSQLLEPEEHRRLSISALTKSNIQVKNDPNNPKAIARRSRNAQIIAWRKEGRSYPWIAAQTGICRVMVSKIFRRATAPLVAEGGGM